ncbi:hypothetical protein VTN02DRAFT_4735 [Thermoascus thermophilus]
MSRNIFMSWEPLFLSTAKEQAAHTFQKLLPAHHCCVECYAKVKEDGLYARIYAQSRSTGHREPAYAVDVAIMDESDKEELLRLTFIVPTAEPRSPVESFHAEWNDSLHVYIVRENPTTEIDALDVDVAEIPKPDLLSWAYEAEDEATAPANGPDNRKLTEAESHAVLAQWETVAYEFWRQQRRALEAEVQGWDIHHFNWMGYEVYDYNPTPAAVSLSSILRRPVLLAQRDVMKLEAILKGAAAHVDPVVYMGDKFYTRHGRWNYDRREQEDGTELDPGSMAIYKSPHWAVADGSVAYPTIPARRPTLLGRKERFPKKSYWDEARLRRVAAKQYHALTPSPLRSSMIVDTEDSEASEHSCGSSESVSSRGLSTSSGCSMDTWTSDAPSQGSGIAVFVEDEKTREVVERTKGALDSFEGRGQSTSEGHCHDKYGAYGSNVDREPDTACHEMHDETGTDKWDLCLLAVEVEDEDSAMDAGVDEGPEHYDFLGYDNPWSPAELSRAGNDYAVSDEKDTNGSRDFTPSEAPVIQIAHKRGRCVEDTSGDEVDLCMTDSDEWPTTVRQGDTVTETVEETSHNASHGTRVRYFSFPEPLFTGVSARVQKQAVCA